MKTAIRIDDVTPDMDWEKFLAFKEILDEYGIKPLIGVVPDNQDENLHRAKPAGDFWEYVKELQESGWCVAMHGYQHIYSTKKGGLFPLNHFSEFAGLSYEKQFQMLKSGQEILNRNGIQTDIFMAPAHAYDKNTLRALRELGFTKITDGFGKSPYFWQGLNFYPIPFLLSRSLRRKKGVTTMVVHTNSIEAGGMARYRKLFAEQKENLISYGSLFAERSVNRGLAGHIRESLLANLKHLLVKMKG